MPTVWKAELDTVERAKRGACREVGQAGWAQSRTSSSRNVSTFSVAVSTPRSRRMPAADVLAAALPVAWSWASSAFWATFWALRLTVYAILVRMCSCLLRPAWASVHCACCCDRSHLAICLPTCCWLNLQLPTEAKVCRAHFPAPMPVSVSVSGMCCVDPHHRRRCPRAPQGAPPCTQPAASLPCTDRGV